MEDQDKAMIASLRFKSMALLSLLLLGYQPTSIPALFPHTSFMRKDASYICNIKFPCSADATPKVCAYYLGTKLDVDDGCFVITEDKNLQSVHLLIAERVAISSDQNTIQHLSTAPHEPYKLYSCTKELVDPPPHIKKDPQQQYVAWHIVEKKPQSKALKIPDNTIIILYDPSFVDRVVSDRWDIESTTIKLPTIIIKSDISEADLYKASVKPLLASVDLNMFHETVRKHVKRQDKLTVSMAERN